MEGPQHDSLDDRFAAERLGPMRIRVAAIAIIAGAIWALQFVLWEELILPTRVYSRAYRAAELVLLGAMLVLAIRARRLAVLEWGTTALQVLLVIAHGLALLVVTDSCVVPFTLSMEWGQMVTVLAAMLTFRPSLVLLGSTLVVGAMATAARAKWDLDLTDHAVLALIYGVVLMHVRSVDGLRRREFDTRARLDRANADLRKNDEARSRLFVNVSHDFRTPLALIHAEAEIAERDASGADRRRAALSRIRLNAASLAELVNQLLELARLDAGRAPRAPKALDLASVARRAVAQFQGAHGASSIELVGEDAPLAVFADPGHVHRILANLVDNAARQVKGGGGGVRIEVRAEGNDAVLDVVDEGAGIPAERREAIFERFASFDSEGGLASGIGLPVARELAELEGGSLVLVSDAAHTTFRLRLPRTNERPLEIAPLTFDLRPLATAPPAVEAPRSDGAQASRDKPNVLVVEDHPEMRGLLVELLSSDFVVETAATFAQADAKLAAKAPTAILADIMLPDGSGYGLLERVRQKRHLDGVPVVLVSALGETEQRIRGIAAGADDYIAKPFSGAELVERVRAACSRGERRARALESQRRDFQAELHDGVTAALSRAALLLSTAEVSAEQLSRARQVIADALAETRGLLAIADGAPVTWERLAHAVSDDVESLTGGFAVESTLTVENDGSVHVLSAIEQHTLRRVLREAITNALKHAQPKTIRCRLRGEAGLVTLVVDDDGHVASTVPGRGLGIARRRLAKLGGDVHWTRTEQGGSVLSASFPHAHARVSARVGPIEAQT